MNSRIHMLAAWSGPLFCITFTIGIWFVARFVPPHDPLATAAEIAAFYQASPMRIQTGLLITMFSAVIWIVWAAEWASQMRRMEGKYPVLADITLGAGVATSVFVLLPVMVWMAAAYRPERNPELLLFFNDFAFIQFVGMVGPAFFQIICIGIAILTDRSSQPQFPRWLGFFTVWFSFMTLTGGLCIFFKVGPFAWNGWLAFWFPLSLYGVWFTVMFVELRKAIRRQAAEE